MAITENLIIDIDQFKYYTGISDAFDPDYLAPIIIQATDLAAQNVLGTALMIELRTKYNADTLAGEYQTLYNSDEASVVKMICWQTAILGLNSMLFKIGAETISVGDTSEVESIGVEELAIMKRNWSSSKVFYENRVKSYLVNNNSSFPELADNTPDYLKASTKTSDTSQGTTYAKNILYDNF